MKLDFFFLPITKSYFCIYCRYILWSTKGPLLFLSPSLLPAEDDWLCCPVEGLLEFWSGCKKKKKIKVLSAVHRSFQTTNFRQVCMCVFKQGRGWWKEWSHWWNEEQSKRRTHRGTRRRLLRLVTEAAGGFGRAGRGPRGTHQMEHMVLVLLQVPKQVVVTRCVTVLKREIWRMQRTGPTFLSTSFKVKWSRSSFPEYTSLWSLEL